MVREAPETPAERDEGRLEEPSFRGILLTGLPGFLREGFLPLGAFYVGLSLSGLAAGIAASTVVSILIYLYERRIGRDGLVVRISLAFVLVQGAIGFASDSTTVYLAQPVLANAAWGVAFLISVLIRRPLSGALACAWYPFPRKFRQTEQFKRVFGVQSLVWGAYFLARSGMRMAALLYGSLESFLAIVFLTGTPVMFLLILWSIRHALRGLAEPDLTSSGREATLGGEHTFVITSDPGDANADRPTAGDLEVPHGLRRRARISANGA
jgi:hypothetical protein